MSSTYLAEKEQVKNIQKGKKSVKQREDIILMEIENKNFLRNLKDLTLKFDPPLCVNCPNRRANSVCINKECGAAKYMQIISGKCHADLHMKAIQKPEMNIQEYLKMLATFMNEQKHLKDSKQSQIIDTKNLNQIFEDFNSIRQHLASLKNKLSIEIEQIKSPQKMYSNLHGRITQALSLCEYENFKEQIQQIKKYVLFEKNKFLWNDARQKFKQFIKILLSLEDSTANSLRKISKSFIGNFSIDLQKLEAKISTGLSNGYHGGPIQAKDGVLTIGGQLPKTAAQFFLDYKLDSEKKYKMRFRFTENPQSYIMVGIMSSQRVHSEWVFGISNEYFCNRFFHTSPQYECGLIIKGG